MPVHYGLVVLQRGIEGVRFRGEATVAGYPDEVDDSHLAERPVDARSLPAWLRETRGRTLTVLHDDGTVCSARVGSIAAYAWALVGGGETMPERTVAKEAFAKGYKFIGAEIDGEACARGSWATLEPATAVRFLPVKAAPEKLRNAALREARRLPVYAAWQAQYEEFKRERDADLAWFARTKTRMRSVNPVPDQWLELDGETQVWVVPDERGGELVVAWFQRRPATQQTTDSPPARSQPLAFWGSLVAIFRVAGGHPAALTPLGPADGAGTNYEFALNGAARVGRGTVDLLYSSDNGPGRITEVNGRYVLYRQQVVWPKAE